MDFNLILSNNTRNDDYVNATALCKLFGKQMKRFLALPETLRLIEKLDGDGKKGHVRSKAGRTFQTYVHPLIAIELASWLSVDFKVVVLETFKRYLDGDASLATEIINRSTDKSAVDRHLEDAKTHSQYLDSYHGLHNELKLHGAYGYHHAAVNKHINTICQVSAGKRPEMNRKQKLQMMAAQAMGEVALMNSEQRGWNAVSVVKRSVDHVLSST